MSINFRNSTISKTKAALKNKVAKRVAQNKTYVYKWRNADSDSVEIQGKKRKYKPSRLGRMFDEIFGNTPTPW